MLVTTKDLAREMGLHPRTVKRWWRLLRVPPDACAGNGCHRWTPRAGKRLLKKWRAHWLKRGFRSGEMAGKFRGEVKAARDKKQLRLKLIFR